MPKLAAKDRKKVDAAEAVGGDFEPLKPGKYVATLSGVEAKTSNNGNPMWVAEFENILNSKGEKQPGRQWYNLNLPTTEKAPENYQNTQEKWETYQALCAGRIKSFFEAFGYTVDSDTDEMVGEQVVLTIGVRTIQNGDRAGQKANSVNGVSSLESVSWAEDVAAGGEGVAGGGDDDEF